jgi:hypothetical protein
LRRRGDLAPAAHGQRDRLLDHYVQPGGECPRRDHRVERRGGRQVEGVNHALPLHCRQIGEDARPLAQHVMCQIG